MLLISIPKPCHEDWNKMLPGEKGAFCNVCSKTVVDFTALSDEEVKNYFLTNQGQKTCGRFKNTQLTDNDNPLPAVLAGNIPLWKKFLAIVVILFGSFLTGCNEQVVGKIAAPGYETTGVTIIEPKCEIETGEPKIEVIESIKGGTEAIIIETISEEIITGDIMVEFPSDTIQVMHEVKKIDSTKKILPGKSDCDSVNKKPSNYIEP